MFVRVKKIKEKEYGYLVKNKWTKKGSRQRVVGYLGKIIHLKRKKDLTFKYNQKPLKKIFLELIDWELKCHGFENFQIDDIKVDLDKKTVLQGKKNIVLAMNEGFLCSHTIKALLKFKPKGHEEQIALQLANSLVETGIKVPHEVFIKLYEKIVMKL